MIKHQVNRLSAFLPMALSGLALLWVLLAVWKGWDRQATDEGGAAHIFQLLIALQAPLAAVFLATADWRRMPRIVLIVSLQLIGLVLAFGAVWFFKL